MNYPALMYKDDRGQHWFVGIFSNQFEDREGEILSWEAHQEYAAWLKETGVKPPLTVLHQPQFPPLFHFVHYMALSTGLISAKEYSDNLNRLYKGVAIGQTESVIPLHGFMLVVARLFGDKVDLINQLKTRSDMWGMSHGFIKLGFDATIIDKYRSFEFSVLPSVMSANVITSISIKDKPIMDAVKGLSPEDRALLESLLDSTELETKAEEAGEILRRILNHKGAEELPEEPVVEETPAEEPYEEIREKILADINLEGLQETFKQIADVFTRFEDRVNDLADRIAAVEVSEDEKIASAFVAPNWTLGIFDQKSAEPEDDALLEKLKDGLPDGVVDEKSAMDNPLNLGFYRMFNPGGGE